jgi:hypothetical protein
VKLIAESAGLGTLHEFLSRIIGWQDERLPDVDKAQRAVRDAAARRMVLVLCGAGDLIATAHRLHDLAIGADRPFVVGEAALASAIENASSGTVCLSADSVPDDIALARDPGVSCAFIVCAPSRADASQVLDVVERTAIVELPPLETRGEDRDRLITAYANDAAQQLGAPSNGFREHELYWLRNVELTSLEDVAELTRRIVVVRNWGVTHGAAKLGLTHAAVASYLRRRGLPL